VSGICIKRGAFHLAFAYTELSCENLNLFKAQSAVKAFISLALILFIKYINISGARRRKREHIAESTNLKSFKDPKRIQTRTIDLRTRKDVLSHCGIAKRKNYFHILNENWRKADEKLGNC
jgi:hypothetical protein